MTCLELLLSSRTLLTMYQSLSLPDDELPIQPLCHTQTLTTCTAPPQHYEWKEEGKTVLTTLDSKFQPLSKMLRDFSHFMKWSSELVISRNAWNIQAGLTHNAWFHYMPVTYRPMSCILYLLVILKLLNVMRHDVIRWLILVHILSHVHHKIHRVMLCKYTSNKHTHHLYEAVEDLGYCTHYTVNSNWT